ncbi:MAG TPA: nuclear transport factor 2 family protein [Phenylobacterium sp.]|jgi:hypothetical protein|nr:nuclear transport factor 2 family protein [Phenylobacterium sp.]
MQARVILFCCVVLGAASSSATAATVPSHSCDSAAERAKISTAVHGLFDALSRDDEGALGRVLSRDFYGFDAGKRVTTASLFETIATYHRAGVIIQWNPGPLDIHVTCGKAWAAWENHGMGGPAGTLKPVSWLESAILSEDHGRWTIDFLHSTLLEPKP